MSEDEAEAVLVALGPRLEWQTIPRNGNQVATTDGSVYYAVVGSDTMWWTYIDDVHKDEGPLFSSQAAAKAACERHHATGKWD